MHVCSLNCLEKGIFYPFFFIPIHFVFLLTFTVAAAHFSCITFFVAEITEYLVEMEDDATVNHF